MVSVPLRTWATMRARLSRMASIAHIRLSLSLPRSWRCADRSPEAMRLAASTASAGSPPSCLSRLRVITQAAATPASSAATPSATNMVRPLAYSSAASLPTSATPSFWYTTYFWSLAI